MWPYQLIEVTCLLQLTAAYVLVFNWIALSIQVNLLKSGAPLLHLAI